MTLPRLRRQPRTPTPRTWDQESRGSHAILILHLSSQSRGDTRLDSEALEATTITIDVDDGAQITVRATGNVSGNVRNGAQLTVLCRANVSSVETSGGGSVSSAP